MLSIQGWCDDYEAPDCGMGCNPLVMCCDQFLCSTFTPMGCGAGFPDNVVGNNCQNEPNTSQTLTLVRSKCENISRGFSIQCHYRNSTSGCGQNPFSEFFQGHCVTATSGQQEKNGRLISWFCCQTVTISQDCNADTMSAWRCSTETNLAPAVHRPR